MAGNHYSLEDLDPKPCKMIIDFYIGQPPEHIGQGVYNYPDGVWDECSPSISPTALSIVAREIDAGNDYGCIYDHYAAMKIQYVRRTNEQ